MVGFVGLWYYCVFYFFVVWVGQGGGSRVRYCRFWDSLDDGFYGCTWLVVDTYFDFFVCHFGCFGFCVCGVFVRVVFGLFRVGYRGDVSLRWLVGSGRCADYYGRFHFFFGHGFCFYVRVRLADGGGDWDLWVGFDGCDLGCSDVLVY